MLKGTHDLFTATNGFGRGHSEIVFLVEELSLDDRLLLNPSSSQRAVDTHVFVPIPCVQHVSQGDHSHIHRVIITITVLIV